MITKAYLLIVQRWH